MPTLKCVFLMNLCRISSPVLPSSHYCMTEHGEHGSWTWWWDLGCLHLINFLHWSLEFTLRSFFILYGFWGNCTLVLAMMVHGLWKWWGDPNECGTPFTFSDRKSGFLFWRGEVPPSPLQNGNFHRSHGSQCAMKNLENTATQSNPD